MALVSISEAAKLVRRNRSTIYRDIERGRLSKSVAPDGEAQIDTSELLRTYGRLHLPDDEDGDAQSREQLRIALLEERNRSLERALALEAELRKVKDQVTNELRARIADKESVIKVLESKVLFLEYDRQVESLSRRPEPEPAQPAAVPPAPVPAPVPTTMPESRDAPPASSDPAPQAAQAPVETPAPHDAPPAFPEMMKSPDPLDDRQDPDRSRIKVFHTEPPPRDMAPPHVPKMETMPPAAPPPIKPPKQRWWRMLIEKKKKPPLHK